MNRKERRAQQKRLRVLNGGRKADTPPLATRQSDGTPAGRLFNQLDQFMRGQMATHGAELPIEVVVGVLMRFTANVAAATAPLEVGADEYAATSGQLFEDERATRRQ